MAVTSFDVDDRTAALLAELQKTFGVKTNAAGERFAELRRLLQELVDRFAFLFGSVELLPRHRVLHLRARRYPSTGHNVIGRLPGEVAERIVVAAHYDTAADRRWSLDSK